MIYEGYYMYYYKAAESIVLTHSWEPCQADHGARPLLYQH